MEAGQRLLRVPPDACGGVGVTETATQRGDRIQREREKQVRTVLTPMVERIIRTAGRAARDAQMGYGPHLACRESGLPREIQDWIKNGCKP
jgi:hypothetical protein